MITHDVRSQRRSYDRGQAGIDRDGGGLIPSFWGILSMQMALLVVFFKNQGIIFIQYPISFRCTTY